MMLKIQLAITGIKYILKYIKMLKVFFVAELFLSVILLHNINVFTKFFIK